jgi:hypothetical protein
LLLVFAALASASTGDITVSQSLDRTSMAFEDTARFQISLTWSGPPLRYRFDRPFRLDVDNLKVINFSSSVSSEGSGDSEVTSKVYNYELTPTLSGTGTIRRLEIEYLTWPDSVSGSLATDPVELHIDNPRPKPKSQQWGAIPYLAGGFVLSGGVVVVVLVAAVRQRRRRTKVTVKSARDEFLEGLVAVRNDAGQDLKRFQTGLYRILSGYLQSRYDLDTNSSPPDQLADRLAEAGAPPVQAERLSGWLARAEREKFAPVAAPPGEVMRLEAEIRQFFESIK